MKEGSRNRPVLAGKFAGMQRLRWRPLFDFYLTSMSSTSNISAVFPGMGPTPRAP